MHIQSLVFCICVSYFQLLAACAASAMMIDGKQMSIDEAIMSAGKDGMMSKSLKKTVFLPVTIASLNNVDKHHYLVIVQYLSPLRLGPAIIHVILYLPNII